MSAEVLMEIGMLWFDNDQKASIPLKVERAARYYQKKYGVDPDLCYVHPGMIKGDKEEGGAMQGGTQADQLTIGNIMVLWNDHVLPDHFWIGVRNDDDPISSGG
jgi:hypothetical protein